MKPEKILKLAISKAVKNGWVEGESYPAHLRMFIWQETIFSHSFAKAFWGEGNWKFIKKTVSLDGTRVIVRLKTWQYHLQQMVLEKEPLKYLEKFL